MHQRCKQTCPQSVFFQCTVGWMLKEKKRKRNDPKGQQVTVFAYIIILVTVLAFSKSIYLTLPLKTSKKVLRIG